MERIQFYPPGENPKGKNYIFFAAHPEDKDAHINELWQEIAGVEGNCVFWFDAQPEEPWDETMTADLDRMQLILFPVTMKLLSMENTAVSKLLPYAQQEKIPILPILLESGLENMYTQIFGDRQYMDKVTKDHTAIPYTEKLKRFLQDVLISREMAEKIRQAFDAYIFLSYRKKDRALAAKLMKLIHEIHQMRDVAIWYDEFLIPGEDFKSNIIDAMDKSDLFAMAVTPNLVNEDNYVLQHEYPRAKQTSMPILAACLADTDPDCYHEKLAEAAQGAEVPDTIDAYDGDALKEALLRKLQHIALAQNNDPMHHYLIGLAYLNGIDVEVDRRKAIRLITDAAEQNCPEAMEELVKIHQVAGELEAALGWQEKVVALWRDRYHTSKSCADARCLADQLDKLGGIFLELTQIKDAIRIFNETVTLYTDCLQDDPDPEVKTKLLQTLKHLSAAYFHDSDFENTRRVSYRVIDALQMGIMTDSERDVLLEAYVDAAAAEERLGDPVAAEALYRKGLQVCAENGLDDTGNLSAAYVHLGLGNLLLSLDNYPESEPHLRKVVEIVNEAMQTTNGVYLWDMQTRAYMLLGKLYACTEQFGKSREALRQALKIAEAVSSAMDDLMMEYHVAMCYRFLGKLYQKWNKHKKEEECYIKSAEVLTALIEKTNSEIYREGLCDCYMSIAVFYCDSQDWERAKSAFATAEEICLGLTNPISREKNLAMMYVKWAQMLHGTNDYLRTKRYLSKARTLAANLLEQGDFPEMYQVICECNFGLAMVYLAWENDSSAIICLEKSLKIAEKWPETAEKYERLAEYCKWLRSIYEKQKNPEQALRAYSAMKAYLAKADKLKKG